jgi:hypothetical protein
MNHRSKAKARIVIDLHRPLSQEEISELPFLLADAVGEFVTRRRASTYLADSHPELPPDGDRREAKLRQVLWRAAIADQIRDSMLSLRVESPPGDSPTEDR